MNDPNFDPNTGLVTDPTTGMVLTHMSGPVDDSSWAEYDGEDRRSSMTAITMTMGMHNPNDYQDEPWMVDGEL